MAFAPAIRAVSLTLILAVGTTPMAPQPARAQSMEQQLLGLGAAVILNQMNRQQQQPQQQRQQPSRSQGQVQRQQAPRVDPARQAAMSLQRNLNALGFDAGPVDGQPGARTRAAVQAFQVSRGFPPSGNLTAMQRLALETDVRANASGGVETAELRRAEVLEAQTYLRELGYNPGTPDGAWGPRSQAALDAFRRDNGMASYNSPLAPGDEAALYSRVHGVGPIARPGAARVATAQAMSPNSAAQASPSFDCTKAGTTTEWAICGNPRLAALDRQLASAWSTRVASAGGSAALLPRQKAWIAARNACGADTTCIDRQMTARITELTGAPPAPIGGNFAGGGGFSGGTSGFDGGGGGFGSSAGGFAVASFGADGVTVPGGTAQGSSGFTAATGGGAVSTAPVASGDWVHLTRNRFLQVPDGLPQQLMLAGIKLDPESLADDNMVLGLLTRQRAETSGQTYNQVSAELSKLNPLERQDAIAAHRRVLLEQAQRIPDLTPDPPIPLAVYLDDGLSNNYGRLTYVEGSGIKLRDSTRISVPIPTGYGYRNGFVVSAVLPGIDIVPMGRDEASAFLNRHQAEYTQRKRLVQVVWGRVTRLGVDETMADFASSNVTGSSGIYGGGRPTTFVPERVTLHYLDQNTANSLVTPETPVVYEWSLDNGAAPVTGGRDALAVARELGLPIEDGHVLASGGDRDVQAGWQTFSNLAWIGANPDVARQGDIFAAVASTLLPEIQKRSFFGDQRQAGANYDLARMYDAERPEQLESLATNLFRDEFLREDAKRAFLTTYYDGILARAPSWPLPLLHKVQVQLGEYDFATGAFPIQNLAQATFRVASTGQLQVSDRGRSGLYSVDRFGNLPGSLPMPPDQARRLRDALRASYPHGGSQITLAWWSDLDWGTDATETENLFNPRRPLNSNEVRPGRATLKRVALFLDPGLSQPLMEIDPEAVLIPNPETTGPDAETASSLARIASAERASGPRLLAAIARGQGGDDAIWQRLARTQNAVLQANEFDAPNAVAATIAELKAQPDGPIWLEGTARLGEYDLNSGTFAFPEGSGYVRFTMRGDTGQTRIAPTLVGANPFQSLPVDPDLARAIVEAAEPGRRQVRFLVRATPRGVTDKSHPRQVETNPNFELLLQPEEVIFWNDGRNGEPTAVLAALSYADDNAALQDRLARRFEPSEFDVLADARPTLDPHVMDLLLLRKLGRGPDGDAADAMMLSAWQSERGASPLPGPRFFDGDTALPQGPEASMLRPSFGSYMTAKAAALGDQFALEMVGARNQPPCGAAAEAGAIYGGDRAVFRALPQSREDANALSQKLRDATGAFEVDHRYGLFHQRPSARYSGNCESWYAFVVLKDAVHEGPQAGTAAATRVEFTLDEVNGYDGPSPVPDMIVRGTAQATRMVSADGTAGDIIEAAMPVAEPDPEPEPEQAQVSRAQPAAPTPATTGTGSGVPADPDGSWPELAEFEMATAEIDILELRTGQSMEEAERLILERGGVVAAFETPAEKINDSGATALAYRRVYITRDGTETLSLASYAPDGPVVALMRRLVLPEGTLPYEQIAGTLIDKYGPPDTDGTEHGMDGLSAWIGDVTGPAAQVCGVIPYSGGGLYGWRRLDGIGAADWQEPRGGRTPWQFGLPDYPPEMLRYADPCKVVLAYMEERPDQFGASGFSLLMVDFDAIRRVEEELSAEETPVDLEIEF